MAASPIRLQTDDAGRTGPLPSVLSEIERHVDVQGRG